MSTVRYTPTLVSRWRINIQAWGGGRSFYNFKTKKWQNSNGWRDNYGFSAYAPNNVANDGTAHYWWHAHKCCGYGYSSKLSHGFWFR